MVSEPSGVRSTLLDLGLEDLIPLPEAVETVRRLGSDEPEQKVREALGVLAREGRIRLWRGAWDREEEQVEVSALDVGRLLEDARWYRYRLDEPGEERLFFVNVDNITGEVS